MAVGAREVLVAYNLWLTEPDLATARRIATDLRSSQVRTLGLQVGAGVQVSCNLLAPLAFGPDAAYDAVSAHARIARAELVGLLPRAVLDQIEPARWTTLDVSPDRTIEARCERGTSTPV
jgi:glutamate formiminotransferase